MVKKKKKGYRKSIIFYVVRFRIDLIGPVCLVMEADHMDVAIVGHSHSTNSWLYCVHV